MKLAHTSRPLDTLALRATLHCLAGCAIGEVLGMVLGNALGWPNGTTVLVSILLAFATGFGLTMWPLLAAGLPLRRAIGLAVAADTASIAVMEIVDNALMLAIPGAMDAHLGSGLFWGSMLASLAVSGLAAFPLNRWLISRGRGHAVVHTHHGHGDEPRVLHESDEPAGAPGGLRPACCATGHGTHDAHDAYGGHAGH